MAQLNGVTLYNAFPVPLGTASTEPSTVPLYVEEAQCSFLETWDCHKHMWEQVERLHLSLLPRVFLGKVFTILGPHFLICRLGIEILRFSSQSSFENQEKQF